MTQTPWLLPPSHSAYRLNPDRSRPPQTQPHTARNVMFTDLQRFPRLVAAFEEGVTRGLHTGLQIYVSVDCVPLLSAGLGYAAPGKLLTVDTLMPWRSAGKPLTALLLLKLLSQPDQQLSQPIADWLPDARYSDKADLTLHELLTHTSGFPTVETGWPHKTWNESISTILRTPCQLPRGTAAYHPQSSWFLLAEIIRVLTANKTPQMTSFADILQHRLLIPLGMTSSSCGIQQPHAPQTAIRLPQLYERQQGKLEISPASVPPWITSPSAGGNLRGPVSELGAFYEMLLRHGKTSRDEPFVSSQLVQFMTSRRRAGMLDQTFQHVVDFGLGIICNSSMYGPRTVPYGFGTRASDAAFGHGGAQCSIGFCDPEKQLVVAWAANGFCGEAQHQRRNQLLNDAIFEDLGF